MGLLTIEKSSTRIKICVLYTNVYGSMKGQDDIPKLFDSIENEKKKKQNQKKKT